MTLLPTVNSEGTFLNIKHERWAIRAENGSIKYQLKLKATGIQYYNVAVDYNVNVF